jgi:hypothetical protein
MGYSTGLDLQSELLQSWCGASECVPLDFESYTITLLCHAAVQDVGLPQRVGQRQGSAISAHVSLEREIQKRFLGKGSLHGALNGVSHPAMRRTTTVKHRQIVHVSIPSTSANLTRPSDYIIHHHL